MSTETVKSVCFIIVFVCFVISTIFFILKEEQNRALKKENCELKRGTLVKTICVKGIVIK